MSKRILTLNVNGRVREDAVADSTLLFDYLRDTAGLTGTKQGCDGGECGACTVLIDGQPRLACITLAAGCEGLCIETIESLATDGRMSRLQQAFHQQLGTQCGFCTPGMIMAAEALLRRNPAPSEAQIREALSGNLCRCTGYVKIIESVQAACGAGASACACAGERAAAAGAECGNRSDGLATRFDAVNAGSEPQAGRAATPPRHAVGQRTPLIDGIEKVTGRARYTADLPFPDALVGRILRSPVAHGLIRAIDTSAARAMPGVRAVITGADFCAPYGVIPIAQNEWPLARDKVRYRGEPLLAVAAVDAATADAALAAIVVDIEPLPAYFNAADARAPGAATLHDNKRGNIEREVEQCFGDVEAGFAGADLVREQTFHYAEVAHGQIELNAAVASYEPELGRLTTHSVTQVPYYLHLTLAQCLGMDSAQIRVIKPFVGGGFGHRVEPLNFEMVTAALARAAGGSVKLELSREDGFLTHRGRPETDIRLKLGMKKSGEITAVDCEITQRGGAYGGYGLVTILYAGALLHALYRLAAVKYRGHRVYTNTPPCGAMRGHGAVDARHAFESLLDACARELGLDPFAVRRANLITPPWRTLNDLQVNSYGIPDCLAWVEQASGWKARRGRLPRGRGLGVACSHYVSGSAKPVHWSGEPHAVINLKLDFDGSVTVLTGASDIGQGSSTLLAQVVAEVLMLPMNRIRVIATDSALTPKDNGSYSSRVSFMVGNAALRAAQELLRVLVAAAATRLKVSAEQIEWLGERCVVAGAQHSPLAAAAPPPQTPGRGSLHGHGKDASDAPALPGQGLDFAEVVSAALVDSGTLIVKGTWSTPPETQGGKFRGAAVGSTAGFSYAAQVVEVEVDEATGVVRVEHVWVAHDCGFAINPLAVEGQVQGAVWMGMGQALSEETQYHEGLPLRANLLDYRIPTIAESPPIDVKLIETHDPLGPFGAKEASEGALHGFAPALTNAIFDAIGIRLSELPATPDRVLEAIHARQREDRLRARRSASATPVAERA
jgi:4-hydroxybenzoyl-CoA reductase subunit alpha